MKIAILINTFYRGSGMDYVAEQQANELAEGGHEVTIFTFDYDHGLEGVEMKKLNWPKYGIFNFMYRLAFPLDIYKNLIYSKKLKDYGIIISHFYPITFLAYFTRKRYPNIEYIFYNHGFSESKFTPLFEKVYKNILRVMSSKTISNADYIISISQYLEDNLKNQIAEKRVIYNRIDVKKFDYNPLEINKDILNVCIKNGPVFLYVGVLTFYKGLILLIKSFRKVIEAYPNAKLFLVGKMSHGFNLNDYLGEEYSKNVLYFGSISDTELGFLYDACDVYVTASTWEGFNLPVVEAQMLGKPVVAFDIGAHKEVVKNGETGILVESFDTEKFAEAMLEVYKNKGIMGEKAKRWAFKFSVENKESESISKFIREWCY